MWLPWLIVAAGLFSVAGGVFGWRWFIENRKARLWVKLFGEGGARVFYVVLGLAIAIVGALGAAGVIDMTPKE